MKLKCSRCNRRKAVAFYQGKKVCRKCYHSLKNIKEYKRKHILNNNGYDK